MAIVTWRRLCLEIKHCSPRRPLGSVRSPAPGPIFIEERIPRAFEVEAGATRADGPERLPRHPPRTLTAPRTPSRPPSWCW